MRPPFIYNDQKYDLSHLNKYEYQYAYQNKKSGRVKEYSITVEFSCHCFTSEIENLTALDKHLIYRENHEVREFNFTRYELSKQTRLIIEKVINGYCFNTGKGNFFTVELVNFEGIKQEYDVFFRLRRTNKNACTLYVESAYIRLAKFQHRRPKKEKILFTTLIIHTMEKKPIISKK